jgi:hypothetical protein
MHKATYRNVVSRPRIFVLSLLVDRIFGVIGKRSLQIPRNRELHRRCQATLRGSLRSALTG